MIARQLLSTGVRHRQRFERALDRGDHPRCNARIARRRFEFVVAEDRLDFADVDPGFEQMRRKAMPQRMQRQARLLDAGRRDRLLEQAAVLPWRDRPLATVAWKEPARVGCHLGVMPFRPLRPPRLEQRQHIRWQHCVAILAPFALYHADNLLRAVDVAHGEPRYLAGAQATAVADRQHGACLEARRHRQDAFDLVGTEDDGNLLRLLQMVDLGGEIEPSQRDLQKEFHPGHDAVAIADRELGVRRQRLRSRQIQRGMRGEPRHADVRETCTKEDLSKCSTVQPSVSAAPRKWTPVTPIRGRVIEVAKHPLLRHKRKSECC